MSGSERYCQDVLAFGLRLSEGVRAFQRTVLAADFGGSKWRGDVDGFGAVREPDNGLSSYYGLFECKSDFNCTFFAQNRDVIRKSVTAGSRATQVSILPRCSHFSKHSGHFNPNNNDCTSGLSSSTAFVCHGPGSGLGKRVRNFAIRRLICVLYLLELGLATSPPLDPNRRRHCDGRRALGRGF